MAKGSPAPGLPPRDADDLSQLPSAVTSAPGAKKSAPKLSDEQILELSDLAPDIPMYAEGIGGTEIAAAEAEAESGTPKEFLALSPQARFACRLRAGGTKIQRIAELMRYQPNSISALLARNPLAKEYILWLQAKMDDKTGTVQQAMQMLLPKAFDRIAGIIQSSANDGLVAKCSFQLFDRVMGKPTEHVEITSNTALTSADIAAIKASNADLHNVINKE